MAGKPKRRVFPSGQATAGCHQPESLTSTRNITRLDQRVDQRRVMRYCCPSSSSSRDDNTQDIQNPLLQLPRQELPVFGNLKSYGVSLKLQERLWNLEVERLLEVASDGTAKALHPDTRVAEDDLLKSQITGETFEKLRYLTDHILYSLHVCIVDDYELLQLESRTQAATDRARKSFDFLFQLTSEGPSLPGRWEARTKTQGMAPMKSTIPSVHVFRPRQESQAVETTPAAETTPAVEASRLDQNTLEQYHYMVDQITATLAHLVTQSRDNDYWQVIALACLAKVSTKLKVLVHDLLGNIKTSIWFAFISTPSNAQEDYKDDDEDEVVRLAVDDTSPTAQRYAAECTAVTQWLTDCFMEVLRGLGAQKPWWTESGDFDMGVLIYPTGLEGARTLVAQDRKGAISGTSDALPISWALNALGLVRELSTCLPMVSQTPYSQSEEGDNFAPKTSLMMDFEPSADVITQDQRRDFQLHTILDFVVTSIPLSLSTPKLGRGFERGLQVISTLSAFNKPTAPGGSFSSYGSVSLRSTRLQQSQSTSETNKTTNNKPENGKLVSSLSSSFLAEIRHHPLIGSLPNRPGSLSTRNLAAEARKKCDHLQNVTRFWMIKENAIIIDCHVYVNVTFFSIAILVVGGLLCGFIVGERLAGVDPFNLTMFSWILGGFILLVAKSIRVSDWTWRDFLLRRVTCRTVQEVIDVTGLESQDILAYLLSLEMYSPLRTSGPFQGTFNKDSAEGGFSIDVKPNLQTLLASGIVPVAVQTLAGPALVCLRLGPGGTGLRSVGGTGRSIATSSASGFLDSNDHADPLSPKRDGDVILIKKQIEWVKVLGMYNSTEARFR